MKIRLLAVLSMVLAVRAPGWETIAAVQSPAGGRSHRHDRASGRRRRQDAALHGARRARCRFATTKPARCTGGCSSSPYTLRARAERTGAAVDVSLERRSRLELVARAPARVRAAAARDPRDAPIDNQGTWLEFSDLVFVDPIGTGYSRPVKAEYGPEFYQTRGDAESVGEFIRVYRNRFDAQRRAARSSPARASASRARPAWPTCSSVAASHVSGAILIGLALPLGQLTAEQRTALNVPTYTATAFANKKLAAGSADATCKRRCARPRRGRPRRYAPALARRDSAQRRRARARWSPSSRASPAFDASADRSQDARDPDAAVQRAAAARSTTASSDATTAG